MAETPETAAKTEVPVPPARGTTGESLPVITIAYPLQNSLECPHCSRSFPGDGMEDLRKHLGDDHPGSHHDWLFLCAFCAKGLEQEEDAINHLLGECRDHLRGMPRTGILQVRERLMAALEPRHSPTPTPVGTQDEEEVPPLPPPIFPPLPPEEPAKTPPPLPSGTPPPSPLDTLPTREKEDARRKK